MNLADYERCKFELSEVVRRLAVLRGAPPGVDEPVQSLMAALAEDRFNLVVVGRFSRGKSTLMNALLGVDRLPTGIVPLTSVITAVGYGSNELVSLTFEGRILKEEVPLDALRSYVTEEGNPGNSRHVKLAEIQLPAELLRRGFYFIDTPGLGSPVWGNTRTTQAFMPAADAVVLVTGFESPLSAEEWEVVEQVRSTRRRLFLVLNKQDVTSPMDREAALAYVHGRLATLEFAITPEVFAASARNGLDARLTADDDEWSASGLASLEGALIRFLAREKSTAFLASLCDRIGALARATAGAPPDLHQALSAIGGEDGATGAAIGGLQPVRSEAAATCSICAATDVGCYEFLAGYQYRLTLDVQARKDFIERHGFCDLHTWRYNSMTSPHGICLSYPGFAEEIARSLVKLSDQANSSPVCAAAVRGLRGDSEQCPACRASEAARRRAVTAVAARLDAGGDAADESAICMAHLAEVLEGAAQPAARRRLLKRQAALFERVSEDMKRYALKFEAIRRPLASRAEEEAPARILRLVAGVPNLTFHRRGE